MTTLHPQYITNSTGEKLSVVLPLKEFNDIIEELEMLDDIRLYDEAKADDDPGLPIDEVYARIEAERKKI